MGTEDKPFEHRAIITLHGHVLSQELPIYGTKTIAVREGTVDLHGEYHLFSQFFFFCREKNSLLIMRSCHYFQMRFQRNISNVTFLDNINVHGLTDYKDIPYNQSNMAGYGHTALPTPKINQAHD